MRKRLLAVLPIAALTAFATVAPVDTGIAAPLYAEPPAIAGIVYLAQAQRGYWNGYRGYRTQRPGYRQGPDGYWYPSRAFRGSADYTGSIRTEPRLRNTCDYGFRPTNGSHYCNY
jgi:hypothetical protein